MSNAPVGTGSVSRVGLDGTVTPFASRFNNPIGLAFAPDAAAPIPEPGTLAVFGGLALAGAVGYRRRKAAAVSPR